jgi:hypothetical protein
VDEVAPRDVTATTVSPLLRPQQRRRDEIRDDLRVDVRDLLPAGVTRGCLDPALRTTWLGAVHESMRTGGGAVTTDVEEPTVGRNYYRVGVRLHHGTSLTLLLNAAAGVVAAAEPSSNHSVITAFADVPGDEVFSRTGLRVAAAADLEQPLLREHLSHLAGDERRDVVGHRPDRLGDLLFNWFD